MSKSRTYLLQLWQDQSGLWAVLKDEQCGQLYQFESLEALTHFLSQIEDDSLPKPPDASGTAMGLE